MRRIAEEYFWGQNKYTPDHGMWLYCASYIAAQEIVGMIVRNFGKNTAIGMKGLLDAMIRKLLPVSERGSQYMIENLDNFSDVFYFEGLTDKAKRYNHKIRGATGAEGWEPGFFMRDPEKIKFGMNKLRKDGAETLDLIKSSKDFDELLENVAYLYPRRCAESSTGLLFILFFVKDFIPKKESDLPDVFSFKVGLDDSAKLEVTDWFSLYYYYVSWQTELDLEIAGRLNVLGYGCIWDGLMHEDYDQRSKRYKSLGISFSPNRCDVLFSDRAVKLYRDFSRYEEKELV